MFMAMVIGGGAARMCYPKADWRMYNLKRRLTRFFIPYSVKDYRYKFPYE